MTEQEAKGKWCPFVRAVNGKIDPGSRSEHATVQPAFNRVVDGESGRWAFPKPAGCIGSDCMAWRIAETGNWTRTFREWMDAEKWIEAIKVYRHYTGSTLKDAKDFVDAVRVGQKPMPTPEPIGFCGLAGKP